MHYIPLNRVPLDPMGATKPFGTAEIIEFALQNDQRFNSNFQGAKAQDRIGKALEKARSEESKYLHAESKDFEILKQALESPAPMPMPNGMTSPPYPINKTTKLIPFIDDVLSAKDTKPEDLENE